MPLQKTRKGYNNVRKKCVRARARVRALTRFGNGNNAVKTGIGLFLLVTFLSEVSVSMADDEFGSCRRNCRTRNEFLFYWTTNFSVATKPDWMWEENKHFNVDETAKVLSSLQAQMVMQNVSLYKFVHAKNYFDLSSKK